VSTIPGQAVTSPAAFTAFYLDNYVSDPEEPASQMTWRVTGTNRLTVTFSNRVATITYPLTTTNTISEQLAFIATDPVGLSGSNTATFVVSPDPPPVVSAIPGQTVVAPGPFSPINLDAYVHDANDPNSQLTWQVTGNSKLAVLLSNRVAFISYVADPRTNISEQLTFRATDPLGFSGSTTATFTVNSNQPPVVAAIPTQTVVAPYSFTPITLDNYVMDPDELPNQMIWQVTGNVRFTVGLSNRVAYITYPLNTTTNITELLTFRATDPVGLSGSGSASFTVRTNGPPVVSAIPAQTNQMPVQFNPINLDNYVSDPGDSPTQMTWTVTGNVKFTATITNRVATITYPLDATNSITERLTFTATDPWGLSGSNSVWFSALYTPPDYTIPRGGSVTDSRVFGAPVAVWDQYDSFRIGIDNDPWWIAYTDLGFDYVSETDERANYRISVPANAPLSTTQIRVEYQILDANTNVLSGVYSNIYYFRIKVTP
jgi:hypothetical protein